MIKAGIVGVSGYGGVELFHILSNHPEVEITAVSSRSYKGKKLSEVYPHLYHTDIMCNDYSPEEIADLCDVVFTAVPHGGPAMDYALPVKKADKKFIDLSADFRLTDIAVYEEWYKTEHKAPDLLKEAVYGLPELHLDDIKKAWLIANPGCYTTAGILALSPAVKQGIIDYKTIIIDSKSGASGGGRKLKEMFHFSELDENLQAYSPSVHRHGPEIEQELSIQGNTKITLTFVPHLVPMIRGILSVSYAQLTEDFLSKVTVEKAEEEIVKIYENFYQDCPFVRILKNVLPNTKYVSGTNFIDIAVKVDIRNKRVMIISALDNLIKGASGQAVQNMNLMFGLDQKSGLNLKPLYP